MKQSTLKKGCAIAIAAYLFLAAAFYLLCGDQLRYRDALTAMPSPAGVIGEITADTVVSQPVVFSGDELLGITLLGATYARENTGSLSVELYDGTELLDARTVEIGALADNQPFSVPLNASAADGGALELRIRAPESAPGNAVTLYYCAAGPEGGAARIDGAALAGPLCMQIRSRTCLWFGAHYWYFAAGLLILLCIFCLILLGKNRAGKKSPTINLFIAFSKYRYLIKQMVARDFKTKYKRSVLGVLWSFLNPLLTMAVQYIVFSTIFRSDIPNFVVYLLSGIVCFNFFSEATSMSLSSITGNAALITKVYVPKYIYPVTRVMSSMINFLLSLIPLFVVILLTGTPIRPPALLLPLAIVCLFAVCLGIGMLLASAMVFFRDMQFLWGVLTMLWMYATPVFYPESIIPGQWMTLYKCNPLYHIIRFVRTILMDGVSPEPKAYGLMLIASFVPLLIGMAVFRRTQDRFVLNI